MGIDGTRLDDCQQGIPQDSPRRLYLDVPARVHVGVADGVDLTGLVKVHHAVQDIPGRDSVAVAVFVVGRFPLEVLSKQSSTRASAHAARPSSNRQSAEDSFGINHGSRTCLDIHLPLRASPGVNWLNQVEIVARLDTEPRREEGTAGLGVVQHLPLGFSVGNAALSNK